MRPHTPPCVQRFTALPRKADACHDASRSVRLAPRNRTLAWADFAGSWGRKRAPITYMESIVRYPLSARKRPNATSILVPTWGILQEHLIISDVLGVCAVQPARSVLLFLSCPGAFLLRVCALFSLCSGQGLLCSFCCEHGIFGSAVAWSLEARVCFAASLKVVLGV